MSVPEPVKSVVLSASRTYGRVTASGRLLPSFLISGGQRCGTTSMYRALAAHPAIRKAVLHKGVHYFDISYGKGMQWYRGHFPTQRAADRQSAQAGGASVQTFESSPYYMYHPLAAERIARDLPDVKLVVLTRDPIERAYSQHAHEVARDFETETDFAKALALEPSRLAGQSELLAADGNAYSFSHQHHGYRARGEYIRYIRRLESAVGRERIHVVDSAEFFATPEKAYDDVIDFLGLPHLGYPTFEQHNARPRALPIPDDVHAELRAHYEPFDAELSEWLGHTVSWRAGTGAPQV
ncbi:MAG TPA: sulfotransferase [Micromonosporaceae bacterium]